MVFNWKCPYCEFNSTIGDANHSEWVLVFDNDNESGGSLALAVLSIVCPNADCRKVTLKASLSPALLQGGRWGPGKTIESWSLRPSSSAMALPDYIPAPIKEDYMEACAIRDLSPKASATLSRRCLQGIIRDYWKITKHRLVDEINALKDLTDIEIWQGIDAVRQIGNIGAHMEKDINVVLEVDPEEAQLLIGLIEMLIKDWYIARHKRQTHLQQLVEAAKEKKL